MRTFKAHFDGSSLEKNKIGIIITILAIMWLVLFSVVIAIVDVIIESVAVILIVFAIAAIISAVLGIWLMQLISRKYDVTADDRSVKLISGKQITELLYSDIDSVSYSFKDIISYRYYGDRHRYAIFATIKLRNGNIIEFTKDLGSVYKNRYSSVEDMAALIGDKSEETALIAYIKSRLNDQ